MYDSEGIDLTEFSLVCETCDAGEVIHSEGDALIAGWSEINYRPDLPMANYSGMCPDCREAYEHWPTAERRNED